MAALSLPLAGCSGGERPGPKPDLSPPTSAVATTASPAWSNAFSADELAGYKAALTQVHRLLDRVGVDLDLRQSDASSASSLSGVLHPVADAWTDDWRAFKQAG